MADKIIAPIFGGALLVGGLVMMWSHRRAWRRQQEEQLEEADRRHLRARYRRRMQVSGMIGLLGILIAVGDALIPWQQQGAARQREALILFAVYWIVVVLLAFWVLLLGIGDMLATRAHGRATMAHYRAQQKVLERELAKARARQSNGKHD